MKRNISRFACGQVCLDVQLHWPAGLNVSGQALVVLEEKLQVRKLHKGSQGGHCHRSFLWRLRLGIPFHLSTMTPMQWSQQLQQGMCGSDHQVGLFYLGVSWSWKLLVFPIFRCPQVSGQKGVGQVREAPSYHVLWELSQIIHLEDTLELFHFTVFKVSIHSG